MGRFINPFTDVGFKLIFGQEVTKDFLIDFLNGPCSTFRMPLRVRANRERRGNSD